MYKTWEETILSIREVPAYDDLIVQTYMDADLVKNVERFKTSIEFIETVKLINQYLPTAKSILDIGCGNGTSSISLAQEGYEVVAVEPDPSDTVGAGAIKILAEKLNVKDLKVYQSYAEDIQFPDESFDVVYVRQAMHHAYDLEKFVKECARVLKRNGLLITIRDHVITDERDKEAFLESHPLHKFYGGENAFTEQQYTDAMEKNGLSIRKVLRLFDSEINFFPLSKKEIGIAKRKKKLVSLTCKILPAFLRKAIQKKADALLNEKDYPGRMYSFISIKL